MQMHIEKMYLSLRRVQPGHHVQSTERSLPSSGAAGSRVLTAGETLHDVFFTASIGLLAEGVGYRATPA